MLFIYLSLDFYLTGPHLFIFIFAHRFVSAAEHSGDVLTSGPRFQIFLAQGMKTASSLYPIVASVNVAAIVCAKSRE